ncbi:MAG: DUF5805 domain-containing protein [Halobacteriales archaeon]
MGQPDSDARVAVKTYVPREQKQLWEDHAENLEMTLSEYLRTMVQSGRSPFEVEKDRSSDANPRGDDLETTIRDILAEGPATFEDLSDEIIGSLEEQLDRTLMEMDKVVISGRTGEYRLVDQ